MENKNIKENVNIQELSETETKKVNGGLGYCDEIAGPGMEMDISSEGNARIKTSATLGSIILNGRP